MPHEETIRVKAKVAVAGLSPGQIGDIRKGYAIALIRSGYVTRADSLDGIITSEPLMFGEWEVDPRPAEESSDG